MIHYVNYTLTVTYSGRLRTEAESYTEAENHVSKIHADLLKSVASTSTQSIQVRADSVLDELQLSFFEDS